MFLAFVIDVRTCVSSFTHTHEYICAALLWSLPNRVLLVSKSLRSRKRFFLLPPQCSMRVMAEQDQDGNRLVFLFRSLLEKKRNCNDVCFFSFADDDERKSSIVKKGKKSKMRILIFLVILELLLPRTDQLDLGK